MSKSEAYEAAGVSLEGGNRFSHEFYTKAQATYVNRSGEFGEPTILGDGFAGARMVDLQPLFDLHDEYPDVEFAKLMCADGAGRKPEVAQRVGKHDTIGIDATAMVVDDAAAQGGEPISIVHGVVVNTTGRESDHPFKQQRIAKYASELAIGFQRGADDAMVVIENGETAEHGEGVPGYGEFRYDLMAASEFLAMKSRMIDGSKIQPGDSIVALREKGFRCNGYSLVLKTLEDVHGHEWHHEPFGESSTWGAEALRPSRIYAGILVQLTGGYRPDREPAAEVHGIAHVTGGGIPEKLGRTLPPGMGASIADPFKPSKAMLEIQKLTEIDDEEMYNVFNMGQGALIVTPEPKKVLKVAGKLGKEVGFVTNGENGRLNIASKALHSSNIRIEHDE